ncbi:MAG TPA: type II toxin-antitoxin system prevent-host-death family antitoxin [Thermoanaerobaculia bacterium]|jgi:prevent-host-death family protein
MRHPLLSRDLVPVQELQEDLASWLDRPTETGRPVVVTQNGKATAVLVPPRMLDEMEEQGEVVREVLEGLREVAAGDVVDDEEVWAEVDELLARYPATATAGCPHSSA